MTDTKKPIEHTSEFFAQNDKLCCERIGCTATATKIPLISLLAHAYFADDTPLEVMIDLRVCEEHTKDLTLEVLQTEAFENMLMQVCLAQKKFPPDFRRGKLLWRSMDDPKYKMMQNVPENTAVETILPPELEKAMTEVEAPADKKHLH